MMTENSSWLSRTELLLGKEKLELLNKSHVLIAGLGGVGSSAAEMLCRAGIGKLTIADSDVFVASNLNRQIPALLSTLGKSKTEIVKQRLLDINPAIEIETVNDYLKDQKLTDLVSLPFDYVIDAIDTFSPKTFLIIKAMAQGHKIVSSMGSGGKTNPELVRVADISETHTCHLAYQLRKRLRRHGISSGFKAVFSTEKTDKNSMIYTDEALNKKTNIGTISYMPVIFGCFCAAVVIRDLTGIEPENMSN